MDPLRRHRFPQCTTAEEWEEEERERVAAVIGYTDPPFLNFIL